MKRSDVALSRAKGEGRNRACTARHRAFAFWSFMLISPAVRAAGVSDQPPKTIFRAQFIPHSPPATFHTSRLAAVSV